MTLSEQTSCLLCWHITHVNIFIWLVWPRFTDTENCDSFTHIFFLFLFSSFLVSLDLMRTFGWQQLPWCTGGISAEMCAHSVGPSAFELEISCSAEVLWSRKSSWPSWFFLVRFLTNFTDFSTRVLEGKWGLEVMWWKAHFLANKDSSPLENWGPLFETTSHKTQCLAMMAFRRVLTALLAVDCNWRTL